MFNPSLQRVLLPVFCLVSLNLCNAPTDNAELKALEAKLTATQAEVAKSKTEVAMLQSRQASVVCGKGEDALLTQSGDLSALLGVGETDIFYPKLYASPPELLLPVELSHIGAQLVEQRTNGYRLSLNRFPDPGIRSLKWQASGVAASSCK